MKTSTPIASRALRAASLAALLALVGVDSADAQRVSARRRLGRGVPGTEFEVNPPTITSSLPAGTAVLVGEELRFEVSVSHPNGHPVSLELVNPPPGIVFHPVANALPPVVRTVRWYVRRESGGLRRLIFRARSALAPAFAATLAVDVRVSGETESPGLEVGDVTGDGVLDVLGVARGADVGGVQDVGALYLWTGTTVPSGTPTATLAVPGAQSGDMLGGTLGAFAPTLVQLADVTGDGTLDVVAGAIVADVNGLPDVGAVYVWAGGPSPAGVMPPSATLTVPSASLWDQLGSSGGQGIELVDVTGDGYLDVAVGAASATVAGAMGAGAVYVWSGGPTLTGTRAPTATLTVPGATQWDQLGWTGSNAQGVLYADVTGDGTPDVVAGASNATVGGLSGVGAIYFWPGGSALSGPVAPASTLTVPGAAAWTQLGLVGSGQSIRLADVTGDGVRDIVAGCVNASFGGVTTVGAVYVWAGGGGLPGATVPTATLMVPNAVQGDSLCTGSGHVLQVVEVTGDGIPDVVAGTHQADVGGVQDTGAVYAWAGGPALVGPVAPTATLTVPTAVALDNLCYADGPAIQVLDVSSDGDADLVVSASNADVGGVQNTGSIHVWRGGPALLGAAAPTASLTVPMAVANDRLGRVGSWLQGAQLADVTGDGHPDVVAAAPAADVGGVQDAGAVYAWAGGPLMAGALPPAATLVVPGAVAFDALGLVGGGIVTGFQIADVSGDGTLDVVAGASQADVGGIQDVGALYAWRGGPALVGTSAPSATLTVPGAVMGDALGQGGGESIQLADVTADAILDVVAAASYADVGGVLDVGAIYTWTGGAGLAGPAVPTATLTVPGAVAFDNLAYFWVGQGLYLADATGDGALDLLATAPQADAVGVMDSGAIYFWMGVLAAPAPPTAILAVPTAVNWDMLGY